MDVAGSSPVASAISLNTCLSLQLFFGRVGLWVHSFVISVFPSQSQNAAFAGNLIKKYSSGSTNTSLQIPEVLFQRGRKAEKIAVQGYFTFLPSISKEDSRWGRRRGELLEERR